MLGGYFWGGVRTELAAADVGVLVEEHGPWTRQQRVQHSYSAGMGGHREPGAAALSRNF